MEIRQCDFCFSPISKNGNSQEVGKVMFGNDNWDVCKSCFGDIKKLKEMLNRRVQERVQI